MNGKNNHTFFEAISQLFGKSAAAPAVSQEGTKNPSPLAEMEVAFNSALQQLNGKIESLTREQQAVKVVALSPRALAEEHERRKETAHALILADILAMHRKLDSGIDKKTLGELLGFLQECAEKVLGPATRQEVMPCCRSSILRRLHHEAGGRAWAELEERLATAHELWPETTQRDHFEDDAAFLRRKEFKYKEVCDDFRNYDIPRSAELILGIERAWQADYPEPGTPLWSELVLEGVATALRARIFRHYYDRLLVNKEKIVDRASELVGRELETLQRVLAEKNLISLEDAHRVADASTRVLDEVIPDIAWQVIIAEEEKTS